MGTQRLTAAAAAHHVAAALREGQEGDAFRLLMQFLDDYHGATPAERATLVQGRPVHTGDSRYDALLAGLVEHVTNIDGTPTPRWVGDPDRFLDQWWFVTGMRALHANALAHTPVSCARRGVFLTEDALERV